VKAVIVRRHGDPSVLSYEEVAAPEPGDGEVLIRVRAAGTNPVDAGNRANGAWAGVELPWIPGYELAGVVERPGPGASGPSPGQRVLAVTDFPRHGGGYAEFAAVPASHVVPIADPVTFTAAAATPLAGGTAWDVLERLKLAAGDRLLVLGASGGVGSFLLQLAALRRITTVAVGRREHHERMRRLGADRCIDYTDAGAATGLTGVDAIADLVGGRAVASWLAALRTHGQIASIADPELDLGDLVDANITFHGVLWDSSGGSARVLADLLADGRLVAHVPHVLPLAEAAQAHRLLESRHPGGKIVLTVG
jgi:NADPH:quinone reductase-like Zn-dependent oxidoreductase